MLGRADTKKAFFTENAKQSWYKKVPLSQYVRRGAGTKNLFPLKMLGETPL